MRKKIASKLRKLQNDEIKDKKVVYTDYNEYCVAMRNAINIVENYNK